MKTYIVLGQRHYGKTLALKAWEEEQKLKKKDSTFLLVSKRKTAQSKVKKE